MKPLAEHEFLTIASELGFTVERFPEGTLRLDLPGSEAPLDISQSVVPTLAGLPAYLIGREQQPPLAGTDYDQTDLVAAALAQHRALCLDSLSEVQSAVANLSRLGWCVDNDAYVLSTTGRWMLYVSHHDTVSLYERIA